MFSGTDIGSFSEKQSAETPQEPQRSDAKVLLSSDKIDKKQELLEDIMNFPSSGIFERYRRLELSSYLGNALKEALTEKDLIKTVDIPTSKYRFKILELTTKGKEFLRKLGHEPKEKQQNIT